MFEHKSEIPSYFAEFDLAPFAAEVAALCRPALAFEAAEQAGAALQLGGTPALSASLVWPEHPSYRNGALLVEKFGGRGPGLVRSFAGPAPLHFVASVDLAAVTRAGALGDRLPAEGRLLFFWDPLAGCYLETEETCRVIWDRSSEAPRCEPPPALQALVEVEYIPAVLPETRMAPIPIWSMPDRFLMQDIGSQDLQDAIGDPDWEAEWDSLFDAIMDTSPITLASGREVRPHRLGGWPIPEQDDPRYAAVAAARGAVERTGRMSDEEEKAACAAEQHEWTLLLQIGLSDFGVFAEGTVYFVMRETDLRARNFDRVHAIYQQT
jgi:uncharacterized protein YwqG